MKNEEVRNFFLNICALCVTSLVLFGIPWILMELIYFLILLFVKY